MAKRPDIPEFDNPPLIEVAASVQFEEIEQLRSAHIGLLYQEFKKQGFFKIEEHLPLPPSQERFGPPKPASPEVRFELLDRAPVNRHWFVKSREDELVQVQPDRLVHNWRKRSGGSEYPRYERIIEAFQSDLELFERFLQQHELGPLTPTLCELTYVNHILPSEAWPERGRLDHVLTVCTNSFNDDSLPTPEEAALAYHFVMKNEAGEPYGRLHVTAQPAVRSTDSNPVLVLTLTARGFPVPRDSTGIRRFMDEGRQWIVRGFSSITTPQMHREWRRIDA